MTNKDLKHLRALCDAATQGEWIVDESDTTSSYKEIYHRTDDGEFCIADSVWANGDAAFIAATDPQTVRALIDEVEELRAALEDINKHAQNQREGQGRTLHMIAIDEISKQALKGTDGK